MRLSGNFHPEWGYLAPVPSVMRAARVVAVATAIGATAGAAVVLSLADRPAPVMAAGAGQTLIVVHSLVQPAEASVPAAPAVPVASATPAAEPVAAAAPAPVIAAVLAMPAAPAKAEAPIQAKLQIGAPLPVQASAPSAPPSVTATIESPPAILLPPAASEPAVAEAAPVAPEPSAAQTAAAKKHDAMRPPLAVGAAPKRKPAESGLAPIFRRLFSAHAGNTRAN